MSLLTELGVFFKFMCYKDSGPTGLAFVISSVSNCLSSAAGNLSALVAVRKHPHRKVWPVRIGSANPDPDRCRAKGAKKIK